MKKVKRVLYSPPNFWWRETSLACRFFAPCALTYGFFARRNMEKKRSKKIDIPVLCIGNFTLGGAGKTPLVIACVKTATQMGLKPGVVSRGFGGSFSGTHKVNNNQDSSQYVGDEPLLLARYSTVVVSKDRHAAALTLQKEGCTLIIMDDGFQSQKLYADYSLLAVDASRGFGNEKVFPAGPLRAPLPVQLSFTDALLVIGNGEGEKQAIKHAIAADKPVFYAHSQSSANRSVIRKKFFAFAGIGNPHNFFSSVEKMGGIIRKKHIFPDHHFFSFQEVESIARQSEQQGLCSATTAKDYVRLKTAGWNKKFPDLIVFDLEIIPDNPILFEDILTQVLERFKSRC